MASQRKKQRALFPEAMRPVPQHIQGLRKRFARAKDHHTASSRALMSDIFDGPGQFDITAILGRLTEGERLKKKKIEIRNMKKEIKQWEKEGTARSRGYMGLRRVVHSFQAYQRLRRMRAQARARQELSDLELLRAIANDRPMRRYDQIRLELLARREKANRRKVEKK